MLPNHQSLTRPVPKNLINKLWSNFISLPKQDQLGIVFILLLAVLAPLLELGGWDFFKAFRRDTLTADYGFKTWHPYPIYWFIYPFAILPPKIGYLFWNLANAFSVIYAIKMWRGRFLNFSISLPLFWLFYSGQIDGFIALGLALGIFGSPYIAGLGLVLLTIKPQVGLLPILFIILHRRDWRIFVVPGIIYLLSFACWGWWIPEWINSILVLEKSGSVTNIGLYPFAFALLPLLWFKRSSLTVWYLVGSLLAPYYAVYSLLSLFCFYFPIWINIAIWAIYLLLIQIDYPIPGFVIPLALLLQYLVFNPIKMRTSPFVSAHAS